LPEIKLLYLIAAVILLYNQTALPTTQSSVKWLSGSVPVATKTEKFEVLTTKITFLLDVHLYVIQLWRHYLEQKGLHQILQTEENLLAAHTITILPRSTFLQAVFYSTII
jgi:hypothetical protein